MNPIRDALLLLRIPFSVYLMPVYFFALSQVPDASVVRSILVFFILHILVYPASNGYNSYMDRDTSSIGGLENPPLPPPLLLTITYVMDVVAIFMAWAFVGHIFAIMVAVYILASRSYSYRRIRLKKYPILGFLTVFIFQGGFTFVMVYLGCSERLMSPLDFFAPPLLYAVLISSFMIGGGYPLTQIYQHEADRESGDQSLSMMLGIRGTFIFSIVMFTIVAYLFYVYFCPDRLLNFILFQLFLLPVIGWFLIWMKKTWQHPFQANFHNMMRMNNLSALCMNAFFILQVILSNL